MATKFSDFTAQAATATAFVVGYDGTTNTQYSQNQLTDFVFDGTLSADRTLKLNGNNLTINYGTGNIFPAISANRFILYPNGNSNAVSTRAAFLTGNIDFNYLGQNTNTIGLNFTGHNTQVRAYGFTFYGGGAFSNNNGYSVIGPNFTYLSGADLTARLGIVGKHNSASSYALRVQNSDSEDIFFVRNDKFVTVTGNNSVSNFFALKNEATWTMLDAGDAGSNAGQLRIKSSNNNRFWFKANDGLAIADSGAVTIDSTAVLKADSTTKGLLPPRMTNTQRDAITSPTAGLMLYSSTDSKLQFYNGSAWQDAAGGDNIYTADGALSGDRTVTLGGYQINLSQGASGNYIQMNGANANSSPVFIDGRRNGQTRAKFSLNSGSGRLELFHFGSTKYVDLNPGGLINYFLTDTAIGSTTASARLHVKGSGTTSATTAFLIENATSPILTIKDNGIFALGIGSSSTDPRAVAIGEGATASNTFDICIGTGTASGGNSVAIGRASSSGADAIAIGTGANSAANCIAMGQASSATGTGISLGVSSSATSSGVTIGGVATSTGVNSVVIGGYASNTSQNTVALGYDVDISTNSNGSIAIGSYINTSAANNVTINATNLNAVNATTANEFGVYMTSNTTPDFKVIGAQGMVPPSITTTVRDAISSPASGSTIYNTTDNKLQFYNGSDWTDAGGGDSIYTADGTISSNRVISFPANVSSITFSYASLGYFYIGSNSISTNGLFRTPVGGRFEIGSYNTRLSANYVQLYSAAYITGTTSGFITIDDSTGTSYNINARLGVIGKSTTSTTDYAFRVQQSDNTDLLTLRDDGAFALGKSASPQGASAVTIGELAETTVSTSIAIGYNSEAAGGIAIGSNADNNQAFSQCIGGNTSNAAQYQTVIGYDADGLSGADRSIAIGASAKAHAQGGIAIGVGANAQNHCIVLGRNVGVSGTPDNSVVFSTRGGNNITYSEADSFTWYNTSNTVPDLKFKPGSDSYWNSSGNFGFGITNPTDRIQVPTSIGIIGDSTNAGKLKLYCEAGTAHHVAIEGPAHTNAGPSYTIKLPNTAPSAGQVLASDANGNLSWKSPHQLDFSNLPTSDPGVEGRLYNDEGTVKVSIP